MNVRKIFIILVLASLFATPFAFINPAQAADGTLLVDQSYTAFPGLHSSIQWYSPVGQSFTPLLPALDVVELDTGDFTWNNGYGAELYVNIRQATIDGPIIGTSNLLQLPDNFYGTTRFTFPAPVLMSPGEIYVIEVVVVGGQAMISYYNWSVGSFWGVTYSRGNAIFTGTEAQNHDLWFREGIASTSPQSSAYCRNGLWAYLTRADGSSFVNQGDCIQYVITGR